MPNDPNLFLYYDGKFVVEYEICGNVIDSINTFDEMSNKFICIMTLSTSPFLGVSSLQQMICLMLSFVWQWHPFTSDRLQKCNHTLKFCPKEEPHHLNCGFHRKLLRSFYAKTVIEDVTDSWGRIIAINAAACCNAARRPSSMTRNALGSQHNREGRIPTVPPLEALSLPYRGP